jgi:2-oxoglutarate ferredoxin oxidoreductase subunit alpha
VLAPVNARDCFELTVLAFDWSEMLRTPVIVLSDKEIGMTTETVDYDGLDELKSYDRKIVHRTDADFKKWTMYGFDSPELISKFAVVGGEVKVTATGSAHNFAGKLKKNDTETISVLKHLEEKIELNRDKLVLVDEDIELDSDTLIISFGITARTMHEAVKIARGQGKRVSSLTVKSLFPIPEKNIVKCAQNVRNVIIAEENMRGQYRSLIAPLLTDKNVIGINKVGSMITPAEILERIG